MQICRSAIVLADLGGDECKTPKGICAHRKDEGLASGSSDANLSSLALGYASKRLACAGAVSFQSKIQHRSLARTMQRNVSDATGFWNVLWLQLIFAVKL
ncbi:hypothetical protein KOW79_020732 [Hemibagrus wyckioides]|uniref:Uncharacterized protein n=1 Tax=Hemibagrus wyckioides TaxID=337641 RepID=A0A9D3N3F2_9TELE|nr:hypothetical protein KOW79_020732 [Hemibagrus wyckioides]